MSIVKESFKIIKKRNKLYYFILIMVFLILFIQSFFAGQYLYKIDKNTAEGLIKKIADTKKTRFIIDAFAQKNYFVAGVGIFINNFLINTITMYLGIILIAPVFVFIANAVGIGLVFGIDSMYSHITVPHFLLILVVGLLEISCLILITYEGLRIGMSWISPSKSNNIKKSIKEASKILVLIAIILIIAAIIETIGIAIFSSRLMGS